MSKLQERCVTGADLRSRFKKLDDHEILEILGLEPGMDEVEEALAWDSQSWDMAGVRDHPLQGCAAQIFDILQRSRLAKDEPDQQ